MWREVQRFPVGEHGRGIYTPLLVCQVSFTFITQLIFFPFQSSDIWVSIDPLQGLGMC